MLTLNQTAGNNSQSIWVLRLRGEGNNLVTNGDFASATGWTEGTDWTIGSGVAAYVNTSPNEGGTLSRSITTTTASYVFEYEVTHQQGTFRLILDSDSGIVASDIELDKTVGKHSIQIKCNGGSTLKITVENSGIDDEITLDNIKLRLLDNTVYISTRDISLDNEYSGQIMHNENYLTDIPFESTIEGSGGAGTVTSFSIAISRYISNANFDGFFNEFYPATDGGIIVGRIIDVGICWVGATADTDITWLFRGRIIDYGYQQRQLNLVVFQESEITDKEVPYYVIQKDNDNGVSYYPYAPDENYGSVLPIVYGSFNIDTFDYDLKRVAPSICVDKRYFTFVQSSHKLYTQNSPIYTNALYKYIAGLDTYLVLIPDNPSASNFNFISKTSLLSSSRVANELIKGKLFIVPKSIGYTSDYNTIQSILDRDNSTYVTVADTNELSVRTEGEASTGDVGVLGQSSSDCQIFVSWQSNNGGNRQITLKYWNQGIATPAYGGSTSSTTTQTGGTWVSATHNFGTSTTSKNDSNLPWTIEEICNLDFVAANTSGTGATSGDLNIRQFVIILSNIIVSSLLKKNTNNVAALSSGGEI